MFDWQKAADERKTSTARFLTTLSKSKARLKYAVLRVSPLKYAVIEYDGGAYHGDFYNSTGRFQHRFKFVEGCEKLTYTQVQDWLTNNALENASE